MSAALTTFAGSRFGDAARFNSWGLVIFTRNNSVPPVVGTGRRLSSRRALRATAAIAVLSLLLAPLAVLGAAAPAEAAILRSFEPVFSANTNGQILMAANTLMTCADADTNCAAARTATSGPANRFSNNNHNSQFVDIDADSGTFNSSSADLTVPSGGAVLFAALVWGGRTNAASPQVNANPALRGNVRLSTPSGSSALTATQVDTSSDPTGVAYQGYIDVTDIVAEAGSGTYAVANVQSSTGGVNQYAGWSLVVAVADPIAPARNLTIFTGFGSVASNDISTTTIPVSGFLTPPSGPVRTTLGAVTYEGDMGIIGDTFKLNNTTISDPLNPANNPFNSTISNRGGQVPTRAPAYNNQLGFDADLYNADDILDNDVTSATLSLTTAGDQYFPGLVTFATELYDPKLLGNKTVIDVDGGAVEPDDVLTYTVPIENIGLDTASRSRFFDAIPTGTTYVPGSITVDGVSQTDATDSGDTAEYVNLANGNVLAYLGSGATSTSGGDIPITTGTAQHTVTFQVTVNANTTNGQQLVNAASLTYRGKVTEAAQASATNAVISPIVTAPTAGNNPPTASSHIVAFSPSPAARDLIIRVLEGDTDPENDVLTVVGVTNAAGGTVTINPDGTVTYAPYDYFAGRDVFTYTIQDSAGNRSTAIVQVDVANSPPVADDDSFTVPAGVTTGVPVLTNDSDANGDAIQVRRVAPTSTQGGTVTLVGGIVSYTPAPGFRGTDTFTYIVEDTRGGSDSATVTLTVANTTPVAVDDSYDTDDQTAVSLSLLANDSDPNGDSLTVSVGTGPANGTLVLNADGTGTYTPDAGFTGTDSFTYTVSDGFGGTSNATVQISVNGTPIAVDDSVTIPGQTSIDIPVLTNDSDPDGDILSVTVTSGPANGGAVVIAGGDIRYTPAAGFAGMDTFEYTVTDAGGLTDTATVTITVQNIAPIANADTAGTGTNTATNPIDVVSNDTDVNVAAGVPGQALTVSGTPTANNGANVVVDSDGALLVTPATGFAGDITVTYTLSDGAGGTATGTLTVTVDGAAPTAVNDSATTPTDTSVLVDVLDNDTDPNTVDTLSIVPGSVSAPVDVDGNLSGTATLEAGQVRYSPPAGFAGTVTFTYEISDGTGRSSTGTTTIQVENAPPVAANDADSTGTDAPVTIDVLSNDTDPNIPGTTQELAVVGAIADNGAIVALNPDGTLTVAPATGFKGTVVVTYTVGDGVGGTDDGTLTITVDNAAPVAAPDMANIPANTSALVDVLGNDSDLNTGDAIDLVPGSLGAPVDGDGVVRGTVVIENGQVRFTPTNAFSGTVTVTYVVTDGTAEATGTLTISVDNFPPVAAPDAFKVTAGEATTIDVLGNDTDSDGGVLSIASVTQPARGGSVAIVGNKLLFTPDAGFTGAVSFSYTLSDGQGGFTTANVSLDVAAAVSATGTGLPVTGADAVSLIALAFGLLLLGALALARGRRMRCRV